MLFFIINFHTSKEKIVLFGSQFADFVMSLYSVLQINGIKIKAKILTNI